eukprot:jgi/Picre1/34547/NNA_002015.t1
MRGGCQDEQEIQDMPEFLDSIKWDSNNLAVAIAQHIEQEVLMQAFVDRNAVNETLQTGLATFYSRSRQDRWCKGETSGIISRFRASILTVTRILLFICQNLLDQHVIRMHRHVIFHRYHGMMRMVEFKFKGSIQVLNMPPCQHCLHWSVLFRKERLLLGLQRSHRGRLSYEYPELLCSKVREEAGLVNVE